MPVAGVAITELVRVSHRTLMLKSLFCFYICVLPKLSINCLFGIEICRFWIEFAYQKIVISIYFGQLQLQ
jgi:hypothetical protein